MSIINRDRRQDFATGFMDFWEGFWGARPIHILLALLAAAWIFVLVAAVVRAGEAPPERSSFTVYGTNHKIEARIVPNTFTKGYQIFDKDWNRTGYIRWNDFSDRYDIYDKDGARKGHMEAPEEKEKKDHDKLLYHGPPAIP